MRLATHSYLCVVFEFTADLNGRLQVCGTHSLLSVQRQLSRCLDRVPDLCPIQLVDRQDAEFVQNLLLVDVALHRLDEIVPNFHAVLRAQAWVVDGELDPGLEGFIKRSDSICSEDEDIFIVFEDAEEYRDKCVAFEIHGRSFLEEHIRFVK